MKKVKAYRIEFTPSPGVSRSIERARKNLEERLGRRVSRSEIVDTILKTFFEKQMSA